MILQQAFGQLSTNGSSSEKSYAYFHSGNGRGEQVIFGKPNTTSGRPLAGPLPFHLLPDTSEVVDGRLRVGGCDLEELAERYGTPVFVYDELHLRRRCRQARSALGGSVFYAAKAFLCFAMAKLVQSEGLGMDVATGGELAGYRAG